MKIKHFRLVPTLSCLMGRAMLGTMMRSRSIQTTRDRSRAKPTSCRCRERSERQSCRTESQKHQDLQEHQLTHFSVYSNKSDQGADFFRDSSLDAKPTCSVLWFLFVLLLLKAGFYLKCLKMSLVRFSNTQVNKYTPLHFINQD